MSQMIKTHKVKNIKRHRLKCPCCDGRIIDSPVSTRSRLYDMEITDELAVDFIDKCKWCSK